MSEIVKRLDFGRLTKDSVVRTPSGGARIPARLTRVGILNYTNADGSVRRELRLPEEVFHKDSLATLRDAPVLEGHPDMVSPENWGTFSRGHVSGEARQDGSFVAADLAVLDANALERVDSGELVEISCGYTCQEDKTPGVWEGQKYDLIQRNIRYNHVGLGPRNWGRAGSEVGLRLDGCATSRLDDTGAQPRKAKTMKVRFDGKEYEMGSEEHILAMTRKLDGLEEDLAKSKKDLEDSCSEEEKMKGKMDEANAKIADLEAKLSEATKQDAIDARVAQRVQLVSSAQQLLGGEYKHDGKSDLEVMKDAITKMRPDAKLDGKSEDYVRARFDALVESGDRADGIEAVPGIVKKVGSAVEARAEQARKDAEDRKRREDEQNAPVWDAVKEGK